MSEPTNLNFLSPLNFSFMLKRAPHVNFFLQECSIPGVLLKSVDIMNPMVMTPYPGDHLDYEVLKIKFKVDEDLKNYMEIHNWIKALGKPKEFKPYKTLQDKEPWMGDGILSDITVGIMNSNRIKKFDCTFIDCFPTYLSGIDFNVTDTSVNFITAECSFKYTYYDIVGVGDYSCDII